MDNLAAKRRDRGQVNETDISHFASFDESELLSLLHSEKPVERSCAAIHLRKYQNPAVVDKLCHQLTVEKKLYTKIALSETLVECAELSIEPLISLLGQIGKNQETKIPVTGFYKVSYPLPRDIAARTICRLGNIAILPLENFIESSKDLNALAQAIDAYGHIIYSNNIKYSSSLLQELCERHPENDFLKYKIARCLSSIHDEWSESFLLETIQTGCKGLRLEALRSLILLKIEVPGNIQNSFSSEMNKLELFLKKQRTKKSSRR
ncbi:MAG: hypothetical protein BA864_04665 [Desulfuromonadales bacterium C00003093]|nr:MAG: hypothetical protein BA864_04665 [Desulfuromonadales bacterium C00003093]